MVYVTFFRVVCLCLLTENVGHTLSRFFFNNFLFTLVILTGHDISNNDLYISVKLLYASFGSIADNTVV